MTEVAALQMNVDTSSVLKAANDLDKFSEASKRAATASGGPASSIAKLVATIDAMDAKLSAIVGSLDKISRSMAAMARASQTAAAANDNLATSASKAASAMAASDAHVVAYAQHLAASAAAQRDFNSHVAAYQSYLQTLPSRQAQSNAHVEAYRNHLKTLPPVLDQVTKASNDNANAMRANAGNIAAQFQDIGVTSAMGMNPLIIALQQGTQLSAVFANTGGGALATLRAAFASVFSPVSLLTIAIVAGAAALIQWGISALSASEKTDTLRKALDNTKLTTSAFGDAQSILGGVIDITTGKMKNQTDAAMALARAQSVQLRVQAMLSQSEGAAALREARGTNAIRNRARIGTGGMGATVAMDLTSAGPNILQSTIDDALNNPLTNVGNSIRFLQQLEKQGRITQEQLLSVSAALSNIANGRANEAQADALDRALNGDRSAISGFLDPKTPRAGRTKTPEKTEAEKQAERWAEILKDADQQQRALEQAGDRIGKYGIDLDRVTATQDLFNKAMDAGIPITEKGTVALNAQGLELQRRATIIAQTMQGNRVKEFNDALSASFERQMLLLRQEAGEIGLTGSALYAYRYEQEQLNIAKAAGLDQDPKVIANVRDQATAYGAATQAIEGARKAVERTKQAIDDARSFAKGLWSDWINGARDGMNVFTAFTRSVINGLNRIIDRLMDKALDGLLGGGGGFLSGLTKLFGAGSLTSSVTKTVAANPSIFAKGGAFGTAERFAKGGAFTNSIVSSPTLFKFANGGKFGLMGEEGPEAVMPLGRDSNGRLGVRATGGTGGRSISIGDVVQNIKIDGGFTPETAVAMIRQGGEQTVAQIRRDLQSMLEQLDRDGGLQ